MDWLRDNWFWLAVGALFIWMHIGRHGSHSGHGGNAVRPADVGPPA